ncbi:hypothetical protein LEN26_013931 [Aphanomyces euteiches]|nr:hypothetical protein LEN26_013931 [Aphanomyces euteiches]
MIRMVAVAGISEKKAQSSLPLNPTSFWNKVPRREESKAQVPTHLHLLINGFRNFLRPVCCKAPYVTHGFLKELFILQVAAMRVLLALALFVLTAASGPSIERHLRESRNLLEAGSGQWANTHLDNHAKSAFGIGENKERKLDDERISRSRTKGKKSMLSNPKRYDSPEMVKVRREHHGLTHKGQLANPVRHGRSPLSYPRRHDSLELMKARREHHSGRK